MDARIPPTFWSDPAREKIGPQIRLTLLWQASSSTLCGAYQFSPARFALDTDLEPEWHQKTLAHAPERFLSEGHWILVRPFIAEQIGDLGRPGRWNNLARALLKPFGLLPQKLQAQLHADYPDLALLFAESPSWHKPLPSHTQALAKPLPRASRPPATPSEQALAKPLPRASALPEGVPEREQGVYKIHSLSTPDPDPDPEGGPGETADPGEVVHTAALDLVGAQALLAYLNAQAGIDYPENPLDLRLAALALYRRDRDAVRKAIWRQCQLFRGTDKAHFLRPGTLLDPQRFGLLYAERDVALRGSGRSSKRLDDVASLEARLATESLAPEERAALHEQIAAAQNPQPA